VALLLESCRAQKLISKDEYEVEKNYFQNTQDSLKYAAMSAERKISSSISASNSARSAILLFLSVCAPLVIIYREYILSGPYSVAEGAKLIESPSLFAGWLKNIFASDLNFLYFAGFLFLFYWGYRLTQSKYGSFLVAFRQYRHKLERILGGRRKALVFGITSVFVGMGLVLGSLLMMYG